MLNLADQALYYSKSSGRNRVTTCPQIPPTWQGGDDNLSRKRAAAATIDAPIPYHAVTALSAALSFRDPLTAEHSRRVADFALLIAHGLMSERECYLLEVAALLHDVGKLGVPEAILQKPGPLTDDEWKLMGAHDDIGVEILNAAFSSPELTAIVAHYHAWFADNDREPDLPSGDAIPLPARILAIADAYDAMVSSNVYRKSRTPEGAIAELAAAPDANSILSLSSGSPACSPPRRHKSVQFRKRLRPLCGWDNNWNGSPRRSKRTISIGWPNWPHSWPPQPRSKGPRPWPRSRAGSNSRRSTSRICMHWSL